MVQKPTEKTAAPVMEKTAAPVMEKPTAPVMEKPSAPVMARDRLPITIREWNKTKNVSESERALVKKWALKKMGELFRAYKNRLWATYKAEKKPPLFEGYLAKQEHNWEEFVKYKESEEAVSLSKKNKKNASEKKYHHHTGRGGYEVAMPKWDAQEAEMERNGITPEPTREGWDIRARNWFLGHGCEYDMKTGDLVESDSKVKVPREKWIQVTADIKAGKLKFAPDREKDLLTLVLGNPEKGGRTRGFGPSVPWSLGFPADAETYRSRARAKQRELEVQNDRMAEFQRQLDQQQREIQQQQREINELKGQREPDNTAGISQRRDSSVADSEAPPTRMIDGGPGDPVDGIKEQTPCDLHEVFRNLSVKVALIRLQPAGGTFMSITLGAATKLLDDMMINYSEWHTERAPQGKKVNSVEETSSLNDKIDVIMSMLVNGRSNVDPNNVPLASLVAQEENVDVNFIKNNNFNNNAYRNNSGNNYRPYPSANGNGYGNSYGNSYNNNRSVPSGLEAMLKEFISTQTAFNKSVEEKLDKIDTIASRVDRLASDVNLLKLKVMPNNDIDNKITTTANAIQVRINENIRLMAELRARWDREENEKLAKENNVAKVWTITTTSNANSSHVAAPPTNGKIIGVGNVSTHSAKRTKLPEIAKTAETACDKTAEIFSNLGNDDPIAVAHNDLDFDDCHISEVIKFLQKLAKSPNASAINLAFTKHITNALIKAREEKLKLETSIPRKLEDGWEPIIKMKFNDFECNALCDLGASISVMPKKIYDMLDLPPLKNCYLDVNLADNVKKKPLGRIDNVHITVNNNLVPVDFVVLDIECNASCPIVLGRPFLRTVGAVIDMREGNIKYQFPLKKGMEHFPRKRMKLPFDSIIRTSYDVDASTLDVT
ncbi:hypothetical protein QYE76_070897 [Lolium multiflorum]|uniref:Uncharacterized protein n=1 Tax=Lolium multiflorum TaxID=4521 RepID=A0AAD8SJ14_LOLMU|nr:hypothetical protein QYE76_070897 [Lolium multiflorum]